MLQKRNRLIESVERDIENIKENLDVYGLYIWTDPADAKRFPPTFRRYEDKINAISADLLRLEHKLNKFIEFMGYEEIPPGNVDFREKED